jgi:hypothetical protein
VRELTQRRIDRSFVLSRSRDIIGPVMGRYTHMEIYGPQDFVCLFSSAFFSRLIFCILACVQ